MTELECDECRGVLINGRGYLVCQDCGLEHDIVLEGSKYYPVEDKEQPLDRVYQKMDLKNGNYPKKKRTNFEIVEDFLHNLNLTSDQRYFLKELIINNPIEDYKNMLISTMKNIIVWNYHITLQEMIEAIPSRHKSKEITQEITVFEHKYRRDYTWLVYRAINKVVHLLKIPLSQLYYIKKEFIDKHRNLSKSSDEVFIAKKVQRFVRTKIDIVKPED